MSNEFIDGGYHTSTKGNINQQWQKLGLSNNPFQTPVSEQELGSSSSNLDYFVPFFYPSGSKQTTIQKLRQPQPCFVYGEPGMGKTALRLALEADCRRVADHSLVVTFQMDKDLGQDKEYWRRLVRNLAIDCFIQVVEQFDFRLPKPPTEEQVKLFGWLIQIAGTPLHQLTRSLLTLPIDAPLDPLLGLSTKWRLVNRFGIRYVSWSKEKHQFLSQAMEYRSQTAIAVEGLQLFQQLVPQIKEQFGFQQLLLFIDGVDTYQRTNSDMLVLIQPLLQQTDSWGVSHIYPKYFLPISLKQAVSTFQKENQPQSSYFQLVLSKPFWSNSKLQELLIARFRAAGSRRTSLNDLGDDDLLEPLDSLLLKAADHSPRQLLQVVNQLLNFYLDQLNQSNSPPKINRNLWKKSERSFKEGTPTQNPREKPDRSPNNWPSDISHPIFC